MRMSDFTKSTSEWHRRMTSQNLSQNGRKENLDDYKEGTKVYFYKLPSASEAEKRGRKAKHVDHYAGPARIIKKVGTRSFLIEYKGADGKLRTFQRDAGMLSLIPPAQTRFDPFAQVDNTNVPQKHRSLVALPLKEGEIVILKDGKEAKDWYWAQIVKVLPTHVLVHYYITNTSLLDGYSNATPTERENNISQASFLKTWRLNGGRGPVTTTPPEGIKETRDIWSGKIKIGDV
jgi:hypothetical protein